MKTLKNTYQLRQLKKLDPAAHQAAQVALRAGFVIMAGEITRRSMHAALDRILAAQVEARPESDLGECVLCESPATTLDSTIGPLCDDCYNAVNGPDDDLDSEAIPFMGEATTSPDVINESGEYGLQPPF